jgi:hypothetical protein
MKVYGPYTRQDGRQHVILYSDGERRTQSYPRYLWEQEYGPIPEGYDVHHIDEDFTNNVISNFELKFHPQHVSEHQSPAEMVDFVCPHCGKFASKPARFIRGNQKKKGKSGPYCSRSCAGKATR